MYILMKFTADELEDTAHLCGAFAEREQAVQQMQSDYERVKDGYEQDNPYDEWECDDIGDDQALLKVESAPYKWAWGIFDTTSHETIYL